MTPIGSSAPWSIGSNTLESSVGHNGRIELFQGTDTRRARPIWVHVFDSVAVDAPSAGVKDPTGLPSVGPTSVDASAGSEFTGIDPTPTLPDASDAEDFVARARTFGRIDEQSLIRVHATGTTQADLPYVITDAADRGTLARRIGIGDGATDADLHRVASAMGHALGALHRRGFVHETLSTDKVLLLAGPTQPHVEPGTLWEDEFVRLDIPGDVSVAAGFDSHGGDRFAPPEQRDGAVSTSSTDIYRLSGVMAEMAAGRERRSGERWVDLLDDVSANGRPELASVLSRGLSAETAFRPLSAEAWTADILPTLGRTGASAASGGTAASSGLGPKLLKGAAALVVVGGLAVAGTALLNRGADDVTTSDPTPIDADDPADAGEDPADAGEDPADAGEDPADAGDEPADNDPIDAGDASTDGDLDAAGDPADTDDDGAEGDPDAAGDPTDAADADGSSADADAGVDDDADGDPSNADAGAEDAADSSAGSTGGDAPANNGNGSGARGGATDGSTPKSSTTTGGAAAGSNLAAVEKPDWEGPNYCPPASGGPVSGMAVVQVTADSMSVEWSAVDEFLNIYVNERFHDTLIPGADQYAIEGLSPMSPYAVSISRGTDKYAGTQVCGQTTSFGPTGGVVGVTMATDFRVSQSSANTITVSWTPDPSNGYSLHIGTKKVATVAAGTSSFTFTGLAPNRIYSLGIRAIEANNRSDILKIDGATSGAAGGPLLGAPVEAPAG